LTKLGYLIKQIKESPVFEKEDECVLVDIDREVPLHKINVVFDVNTALQEQLELEGGVSYLSNKYRAHRDRIELLKNRKWYEVVKINGARSPDNHLDDEFNRIEDAYNEYKIIYSFTIKSLFS